ncbi:MAG: metallophosphoesterase [Campylobacterota bacterium]|nr:metallophosphoesterase [Campylobacterota bacterium]
MKILHTTDLHFNKHWFEWIKNQQNNYDIFCITGDFLEDKKEESLLEQIDWISSWMKDFKKPLFICSGNHDIEELENEDWFNKISNIYSDNSIKTIDGIKFACIPYIAPEFYEYDECDVILYHLPPAKTKTAIHKKNDEDWGDKEFYRVLKNGIIQPKIVLCGHMHYPSETIGKIKNTTIYNTGVNKKSDIPNHHIIEV